MEQLKELIAKTLHVASSRRDAPFIAVNCGAIPETLFESELFGHKKGAFTGAFTDRKGLLEKAQGGTFFFDEISEIPLSVQAKLLRVIQENEFYPLGGGEKVSLRVRMLAASNTDLVEEVKNGNFREDLYYRIHVIPIMLPPLRKRKESIPLLAHHFLNEFRNHMKKPVKKFSSRAMDKLLELTQGNVTKAAKLAGKYRADLYELMKKCGLRIDDFRKDL